LPPICFSYRQSLKLSLGLRFERSPDHLTALGNQIQADQLLTVRADVEGTAEGAALWGDPGGHHLAGAASGVTRAGEIGGDLEVAPPSSPMAPMPFTWLLTWAISSAWKPC